MGCGSCGCGVNQPGIEKRGDMNKLYYEAIFGSDELLNSEIDKSFEEDKVLELVSVAAYKKDSELIERIYNTAIGEEENFPLLDELIFYLAYMDNGIEILEQIFEKTNNSKLQLEIISSITEIDREKGVEYISDFIKSEDLGKMSIAIYLIDRFNVSELKGELIALIGKQMLEDLKYQALFTLGKLKYEKILPLLIKGSLNKNDQQLLYIEAIKNYDDEKVRTLLKRESRRMFQDKLIKLKLAQIIYSYDEEAANEIFSKFIKSKKLDIQGYTIELISNLKNDKFIPEVNDIFKSNKSFNKANAIMYFRRVNYSSKLKELQEFYFEENTNANMKSEILKFVSSVDKNEETLKAFADKLPDLDKEILLKNIIDERLRQRNV